MLPKIYVHGAGGCRIDLNIMESAVLATSQLSPQYTPGFTLMAHSGIAAHLLTGGLPLQSVVAGLVFITMTGMMVLAQD